MSRIPSFHVDENNLAAAWEKAVLCCWYNGIQLKTEYDKEGDPPSRDCTMTIHVREAFAEPRIHRAFPGGLEDLEVYRQEVINGIHDHYMSVEGGWKYTYHQRLFEYPALRGATDQILFIIGKLAETPYSRRAQAITWDVNTDINIDDPPCLQRVWCRMSSNDADELYLNMNTHWRSRDGYKAAYMNMFALTELQKVIAHEISLDLEKDVHIGSYTDISDSFHIYGSYFSDFEGFLKSVEDRDFEQRTWTTEFAKPIFEETAAKIAQELDAEGRNKN